MRSSILIIEEKEEEYKWIRTLLGAIESFTPNCTRVLSFQEALHRAKTESFDVILFQYDSQKSLEDLEKSQIHIPLIVIVGDQGSKEVLKNSKIKFTDLLLKESLNTDLLDRSLRLVLQTRTTEENLNLLKIGIERSKDIFLITEASPIDEPGPRIVYVNGAFERLTGYKREEVLGKTPRILQGPKTDRKVLDRIRKAISEAKPCFEEIVNYDKDGKEYWIEMDIFPIVNDQGIVTHLMGIERDITERRNTEERIRHSQKMEAVGQLAGGMAHDFNNLLNVILANLDLLEMKLKDSEDLMKRVRSAQDAIQRGVEINKRLLAFSRKQALNPESCDVNRVLRDFVPILDRIKTEKVEIEYEIADEKTICDIEKTGLENALLNLALNARDAMPEGGKIFISTGFVRNGDTIGPKISGLEAKDYFLVSVTDTGTGMDDLTKARIFDPFFSTKGGGKGTGLGLTMVYGFVKQSNGFLKVITAPEFGSSFLIFLPVHRQDESQDIPATKRKTLVMEENRETAELACVYLRELGYEPHISSDMNRLAKFFSGDPEISFVLLDLQLADSKGIDLKKELERFGSGKLIATSSSRGDNSELPNSVPLVRKPYTKTSLKEAVRNIGEILP
ncbi:MULTISPECIES: PAS domain S-box protein [unclassified Leptospira]|uniref:PAS domain S-box protein n=1 Tax=unclassified Leptospira TaxID=2633828 RepID=UPI0002BE5239|nr:MULTISPECIES: PAS domain S-box protein [unclassified Leptospira]EMK01023.1 PAS domain S-box protein [Leptospira sp. B5-022]MCR1794192.1 PAS domain S-box protein [Leptospira sp. id769339]